MISHFFFFFFFQAEDGIRDLYVTGVQTCALPIFRARRTTSRHRHERSPTSRQRARRRGRRRAAQQREYWVRSLGADSRRRIERTCTRSCKPLGVHVEPGWHRAGPMRTMTTETTDVERPLADAAS